MRGLKDCIIDWILRVVWTRRVGKNNPRERASTRILISEHEEKYRKSIQWWDCILFKNVQTQQSKWLRKDWIIDWILRVVWTRRVGKNNPRERASTRITYFGTRGKNRKSIQWWDCILFYNGEIVYCSTMVRLYTSCILFYNGEIVYCSIQWWDCILFYNGEIVYCSKMFKHNNKVIKDWMDWIFVVVRS